MDKLKESRVMKEMYFCNNCRTWNMELPQNPQLKPDWWYVYCGRCGVPRHLRDVINCSIEQSHKIAGDAAADQAANRRMDLN
jgi:hypothetical protein